MPTQAPELVLIAAVARNRVIGKDNQLLWHLPEDMAHFKALTAGYPVIMGRKTWESLPPRFRPLPGRHNIVISRQKDYSAPGASVVDSLENALQQASTVAAPGAPVFVIGGEQIYAQALAQAQRLEITEVDLAPAGDAWFPEISTVDWQNVEKRAGQPPSDAAAGPAYCFVTYRRRPQAS